MEKKYQLPKEFLDKWVKALRSRKYKQTKGVLCDNDGYCCLGVAGLVSGIPIKELRKYSVLKPHFNMPEIITGNAKPDNLIAFLVNHNDGEHAEHWGFMKISDWLTTHVQPI